VCRGFLRSCFHLSFIVAAIFIFVGSGFAQNQHRGPEAPAPPKATTKPTGTWDPKSIAYLKAPNSKSDLQFGGAVALSADGNTLVVGTVKDDSAAKGVNGNENDHSAAGAGAVYVYVRGAGGWKQQAYVKSSNTDAGDGFGYSLALSADGNTLAVGANGEASAATGVNGNQADNSMPGAGAVYIFTREGIAWRQTAYLKASNTGEADDGDQFGYSIALSGDGKTLAAGAIAEDSGATGVNGNGADNSVPESGAVYVFSNANGAWTQQAYVKPWNTTVRGALFGYSVGLSDDGNTLAVGAYDEGGGRGAVYAFSRTGSTWIQQMRLVASNAERGDSLGCSIAISGDGNTILAGAFDEDALLTGIQPPDAGANDEKDDSSVGAAYVFVRSNGKWKQQAYMKAFNSRVNDQFGWGLAISRDGNAIAVGSHLEDSKATGLNGDQTDPSAEDSGAVYIYARDGNSWSPAAYVKASNTKAAAEFGISLALSGDGKVLAVGALKEDGGGKGINPKQAGAPAKASGAAYVYY
jgi:hypothetical protein